MQSHSIEDNDSENNKINFEQTKRELKTQCQYKKTPCIKRFTFYASM